MMYKKALFFFITIIVFNNHANDNTTIVIDNKSAMKITVLAQAENIAHCIYQTQTLLGTITGICHFFAIEPLITSTLALRPWNPEDPGSPGHITRYTLYIIDQAETPRVLGIKQRIPWGTKIEFPKDFELNPTALPPQPMVKGNP